MLATSSRIAVSGTVAVGGGEEGDWELTNLRREPGSRAVDAASLEDAESCGETAAVSCDGFDVAEEP